MIRIALTILICCLWASTAGAAQLVLISDTTAKPGQAKGDVVALLPDSHQFSSYELQIFQVVHITDVTDDELKQAILALGDISARISKYAWNVQTTETHMTLRDLKKCVTVKP